MIVRIAVPLACSCVLTWAMFATAEGPVDVQPRPLEAIPPGTVIGEGAPRGWTDLVLFARPRLGVGDVAETPEMVASYSRMFCLTILAKVHGDARDGYRLDKVAIGLAVNVEGKNVVANSENNAGADLGLIGGRVLAENESILAENVRQVARTPTMRVFDHKAFVRRGGKHRPMVIRHAILASPITGKVSTFVWLLGPSSGGGYVLAEKGLQKLPPSFREDRILSVDANKFTLGIPSADAFALDRLPQGISLGFSEPLKSVAASRSFTVESARKLESELAVRYVPVVAKLKVAASPGRR